MKGSRWGLALMCFLPSNAGFTLCVSVGVFSYLICGVYIEVSVLLPLMRSSCWGFALGYFFTSYAGFKLWVNIGVFSYLKCGVHIGG